MPCITLLSDFGLHDASVAVAKGVLMQYAGETTIVDISHDVTPFHKGQAAYLLSAAYRNFPEGTVHVVLFDIFSDETPRLLLSQYRGHYFLIPDNGILPAALGELPERTWMCLDLAKADSFTDWLHAAGSAIHTLPDKKKSPRSQPDYIIKSGHRQAPQLNGDEVACDIIHIDRYENVVTNMTRAHFEAIGNGRRFRLQFMGAEEITEISKHYQDVREGFKLCRFNSNGYLEICINRGHAASLFGLRLGSRHNDIKIYFE